MKEFFDGLDEETAHLARFLRAAVCKSDKAVTETMGAFMNAREALLYHEEDVLKYALTSTVRGLSFHSMVMYSDAEAAHFARSRLTGVRLQKGCFTIHAPEAFERPAFEDFIRFNASRDFSPVIEHYQRRVKPKKRNVK